MGENRKGNYVKFEYNGLVINTRVIRDNNNDKALRYLIIGPTGDKSQNVWIPKRYLNEYGDQIKDLRWFWSSKMNQHKLKLAGY